jgi:hypothetical protein
MDAANKLTRQVIEDLVSGRMNSQGDKNGTGLDILTLLVESGKYNYEECIGQVMIMLAAAYDFPSSLPENILSGLCPGG